MSDDLERHPVQIIVKDHYNNDDDDEDCDYDKDGV